MEKKLLAVLLLSFTLSACQPGLTREDPQLIVSPDRTDAMLADAADRATKALESLASIEKAKNPGDGDAALPNAPTELRRSVTMSWNGPVEPVARLLADRASYSFQASGAAPPTGLIVNINVKNEPVVAVLRSVGLQLGTRGTLKVDPNQRVIEIIYAPTDIMGDVAKGGDDIAPINKDMLLPPAKPDLKESQ